MGVRIEVERLGHRYRTSEGVLDVLQEISLVVEPGGYLSVTGQSGAGKSTLLSVLGGLESPQQGDVRVGDDDLRLLEGDDLARYRRRTVGFIFQHFGLLEALTAVENVELAASLSRTGRRERRRRALDLLDAVGLAHRRDHRPLQMSGGERQRVAMARALVNEPGLILADEPTGNLDEESAALVVDLLERLHRERGATLVVVTHSSNVAARAPAHLRLRAGRVER